MGLLKKLASDAAIYGLSSIVSRLLNYVLVPFHTWFFAPGAYGEISVFYAYVAFFNVVYTFGLETAYFRFATKHKADEAQYFNLALTAIGLVGAGLSGLLLVGAAPLAQVIGYPGHGVYVACFAGLLWVDALAALPFARLRLRGQAKRFAAIKTASILANVGLNFFFLWLCPQWASGAWGASWQPLGQAIYQPQWAVGYVFLANLLANLVQLPFLWPAWRGFKPAWPPALAKPLLAYAWPLLFMGLAGMVNETLDRQLLKFWLPAGFYPGHDNDAAVGIYSAGYKLSIFISLAIQAFRYSAEPFFFAQSADKNSPPLFAKVMHYFVILLLGMGLAVVANLDWLGQVFLRGRAYRESLDMVPILLMANILLGVYYNLTVWFKITDRTQYGLWFTLAGAGVTVLANWLLIPQLGYFGSAWGHLLCYLTLCGLCYFYGQRFYPIPYRWGAALGYLLLALALGAAAWLVTTGHPAADFLLRNLAVLAFGAVVFWRERAGLRGVKA